MAKLPVVKILNYKGSELLHLTNKPGVGGLISFKYVYTTEEDDHDSCEIVFRYNTFPNFKLKNIEPGTNVSVLWGYPNRLSNPRLLTVEDLRVKVSSQGYTIMLKLVPQSEYEIGTGVTSIEDLVSRGVTLDYVYKHDGVWAKATITKKPGQAAEVEVDAKSDLKTAESDIPEGFQYNHPMYMVDITMGAAPYGSSTGSMRVARLEDPALLDFLKVVGIKEEALRDRFEKILAKALREYLSDFYTIQTRDKKLTLSPHEIGSKAGFVLDLGKGTGDVLPKGVISCEFTIGDAPINGVGMNGKSFNPITGQEDNASIYQKEGLLPAPIIAHKQTDGSIVNRIGNYVDVLARNEAQVALENGEINQVEYNARIIKIQEEEKTKQNIQNFNSEINNIPEYMGTLIYIEDKGLAIRSPGGRTEILNEKGLAKYSAQLKTLRDNKTEKQHRENVDEVFGNNRGNGFYREPEDYIDPRTSKEFDEGDVNYRTVSITGHSTAEEDAWDARIQDDYKYHVEKSTGKADSQFDTNIGNLADESRFNPVNLNYLTTRITSGESGKALFNKGMGEIQNAFYNKMLARISIEGTPNIEVDFNFVITAKEETLAGKYHCRKCTHSISSMGYITIMEAFIIPRDLYRRAIGLSVGDELEEFLNSEEAEQLASDALNEAIGSNTIQQLIQANDVAEDLAKERGRKIKVHTAEDAETFQKYSPVKSPQYEKDPNTLKSKW
jgi:hypothetical protein